jgi:hypothetical protein
MSVSPMPSGPFSKDRDYTQMRSATEAATCPTSQRGLVKEMERINCMLDETNTLLTELEHRLDPILVPAAQRCAPQLQDGMEPLSAALRAAELIAAQIVAHHEQIKLLIGRVTL